MVTKSLTDSFYLLSIIITPHQLNWSEHLSLKQFVAGSSPAWGAIFFQSVISILVGIHVQRVLQVQVLRQPPILRQFSGQNVWALKPRRSVVRIHHGEPISPLQLSWSKERVGQSIRKTFTTCRKVDVAGKGYAYSYFGTSNRQSTELIIRLSVVQVHPGAPFRLSSLIGQNTGPKKSEVGVRLLSQPPFTKKSHKA